MDSVGQVTVSSNSLDHVLTICESGPTGIWTTIKGSSVIELWDSDTLKCKLLFDVKLGKTISEKKDDDGRLNGSRISSFLPYDGHLWIGTGDGNLLIYRVQEAPKPRSQSFPRAVNNKACEDSALVNMEEVLKRMEELQRLRRTEVLDETKRSLTSSDSSPKKSPRPLKKQHRVEDDVICNGHTNEAPRSPLTLHKQGLLPVENLSVAKPVTQENSEERAEKQSDQKRHPSHIFSTLDAQTAALKAIEEVNSGSPEPSRRGQAQYGSKRWKNRRKIPQVSIQDSSGSVEQDSDTKHSQSKGSSPVTIPRHQQYSVPNNTPLNPEQHTANSLTPRDQSDHAASVSPNFQRRPSRRAKSDSSALAKSPTRQGASPHRGPASHAPYYPYELVLQAKIKIADKPIRCLVRSSSGGEPVIISAAGCFGDDEAVLKWKRDKYQENMWTNEPVLEVCPETNTPRRPSYVKTQSLMRSRSTSTARSLSDEAF